MDEDEGRPIIQVKIFQAVAAAMAEMMPLTVMESIPAIPWPIVFATAVPRKSDPKSTRSAVMISALRSLMDLDDMMVVDDIGGIMEAVAEVEEQPQGNGQICNLQSSHLGMIPEIRPVWLP
jgi:hypothetical protein